ncbi:MAG: FG-GAP-like repeat-containing protein [Isosphaeraceae bacterium]|nr:FG-GAP-like repeat-containing protein [Isosphaeraceae bacterium]
MIPPRLPPRRSSSRRRSAGQRARAALCPWIERLEDRCVLSASDPLSQPSIALGTDPNISVPGLIAQTGGQDLYRFTLDADGLLTAQVNPAGFNTLLSLRDGHGNVLIQSEAISPTNLDGRLALHVPAGTCFLSVASQSGTGAFDLLTTFTAALPPDAAMAEGAGAYGVSTADLNGDHVPDIVIPDYYDNQLLINFGVGDGTFQPPVAVPAGSGPVQVVVGDFTGNGILDLAVADQVSNSVLILLGNGDGTYRTGPTIATDGGPTGLVVGDFTGNGRLDLAVANEAGDSVQVFLGNGDGTFTLSDRVGGLMGATALAAADFTGDGQLDLAVASKEGGDVIVLRGNGDGTFTAQQQLPVGPGCNSVVVGDFNGDGRPDVAALSPGDATVSVFTDLPGGSLAFSTRLATGAQPSDLVAADFTGHGHLDLAVSDYGSDSVSLFAGNGDGTFQAARTLATGNGPTAVAAADLKGDGRPDLVTSDFIGLTVSVLLNHGDGTFTTPPKTPPSAGPEAVVAADLTGNGILDLVTPDAGTNSVSILLGRGDGTFQEPIQVAAGAGPYGVAVGDFNGDGIPDLAVADFFSNTISILQGRGDGTFKLAGTLQSDDGPSYIKAADLNGDGRIDLVVANYLGNDISIFYGNGDGTFSKPDVLPAGLAPSGVVLGDFTGDGRTDIAVSDSGSNDVEIYLNTGGGTFALGKSYPVGNQPYSVSAADLTQDGHADLVVADYGSSNPSVISVLLGNGDGTFRAARTVPVGNGPYPVAIGDFNGGGIPDIVTGNIGANDLSLLLGHGDGTFAPAVSIPSGTAPFGVAVGDFRGDGHLDVVSANNVSSTLTVDLGQGNGTFESPITVSLTAPTVPMVTADFTDDGQTDMAVADPSAGTVTIRLGQGDGTFVDATPIVVGGEPSALVAGDFNGDGRPDLAVADAQTGAVLILLGLGDGTFQAPIRIQVGGTPDALVAGDFNGDGHLDLAVADSRSNDVAILYGAGDGTFRLGPRLAVGNEPIALVAADLGNGHVDLVTADRTSGDLTFLWNDGSGNFQRTTWSTPGLAPSALVAADFNGDGPIDLAVANQTSNQVLILWGKGDGTFGAPDSLAVGAGPDALAASDLDATNGGGADLIVADAGSQDLTVFRGLTPGSYRHRYTIALIGRPTGVLAGPLNNDNLPDIAVADASTGQIDVLLGGGDGVFSSAESTVPLPHAAPVVGNGAVLTIDQNGQILLRNPQPGSPGEFSAPIVVTADGTGNTASEVIPVATSFGTVYASLDQHRPLLILSLPLPPGVAVPPLPPGAFLETLAGDAGQIAVWYLPLPDGGIYTRMVAGDIDNDGRDDLLILDRGSDQVLVLGEGANGQFSEQGQPLKVGSGPTDLTLAYLNGDGRLDLLVANGASGDVSLFYGGPGGNFGPEIRLAAGLSPAGTVTLPDGLTPTSPDEPVGITTGVFDASGRTDAVVVLRGSDEISILKGTPGGGLADPSLRTTYQTGLDPTQVVAAPLGTNGLLDLAVLNEGSHDISIFLNNGHGGFAPTARVDAGNDPTGLAVHDVNGDGIPDLLVSNADGDLLILLGNGDGTFQPYERADSGVSLAFGNLQGNGQPDIVLSNTSQDLLSVQSLQSTYSFLQGRSNGLLAPGPVAIADMNGDGISDLIVVNRGGNDVLVYLGLGGGNFAAPLAFYTGTAPEGLTVAYLTNDGLPDLVVTNAGSNDITILLGEQGPGGWTMVEGPRLHVGARPVSTTVVDLSGNGIPDILCVNQDSDSVTLLRGLGGGFFEDVNPPTFATGQAPIQAFVGRFSAASSEGLVVLNSLSNDMTFYPDITQSSPTSLTIPTGGIDPIAGVTGDFTHNGFDSLVIAHNGDSRITLFAGTPTGLVLTDSVALAGSVHPTDVVVSNSDEDGLQLYVSAQGMGRAIPISLSLSTAVAVPVAEPLGSVPADEAGRSSFTGAASSLLGLNAFFGEEGIIGVGSQGPPASVTATTSENSTTFGSVAGVVMSIVSQAGQPPFSASLRSLSWLVDNLVWMGEARTSDILPLGNGDLATVAVILAVSSTLDRSEEGLDPILSGSAEGDRLAVETDPLLSSLLNHDAEPTPPPAPSALARFLGSPREPVVASAADYGVFPPSAVGLTSEWVWRQPATAVPRPPTMGRPPANPDRDPPTHLPEWRVSPDPGTPPAVTPAGVDEMEAAVAPAVPQTAAFFVSALFLTAAVLWKRCKTTLGSRGTGRSRSLRSALARRLRGRRARSSFPGTGYHRAIR